MAELIYHVAVSLDNFIADQAMIDGNITDSHFLFEGEHVPDFLSDIQHYDAVLMGGKTYEFGFKFGANPGEPGYKGIKHYIFSSSMQFESNEEVELIKEDAIGFTKNLKQKENGKIWLCGGGELAGSLLKHKLIDQLVLKVNPIIVGGGISLFGNEKPCLRLKLADMKQYSNGVLKPTYHIIYT
ncbi:deaminase [Bacillus sp. SA1-12]|uniref:dihydrofolate reductase family protein n=1 Tax=Bacillus sp. SA1-12 TaxID=1455638 RepID=UPI00062723CE|nr:dihydrofolate reductase family protein [Bacillus sp. SA1-12]KKI90532.1 deaminase [Bacillus sp. SA1-12]